MKAMRLGDMSTISYGYTAKASYAELGPRFLRITDIQNGAVDWGTVPTCRISQEDIEKHRLVDGDIVFARTGATTGKSYRIAGAPEAVPASYLIRVRITKSDVDPRFVELFFQTRSYWDMVMLGTSGSAQGGFNASKLAELRIPLPPLPEQKRIVAILDEAFAVIATAVANTEKNLANARELFETTVVSRIFGDPDQKGWSSISVEALAAEEKGAIRTGPFGSQLLHGEFGDAGVAVLGIDNAVRNEFTWGKRRFITEEKYQQLKRYTVKPGDVIVTIMGTCGRCAVVPDDIPLAINTKHLCCITLDREKCLPGFLHGYFLYHPVARKYLEEQAKGSIMAGLNMGIVKNLPVRLPRIEEQVAIVDSIDDLKIQVSSVELNLERKLNALAELKQSLLQKAFSGELTAGKAASDAMRQAEEVA